jgi:hypothetical protein
MKDFGLVEIEKHEIYGGFVCHLRRQRGDKARKLSDKSHRSVRRVIAISWFLRAAFL